MAHLLRSLPKVARTHRDRNEQETGSKPHITRKVLLGARSVPLLGRWLAAGTLRDTFSIFVVVATIDIRSLFGKKQIPVSQIHFPVLIAREFFDQPKEYQLVIRPVDARPGAIFENSLFFSLFAGNFP
jgi:hypothetical protein